MEMLIDQFVSLATGGRPDDMLLVSIGLATTLALIWQLGGRAWALVYFLTSLWTGDEFLAFVLGLGSAFVLRALGIIFKLSLPRSPFLSRARD